MKLFLCSSSITKNLVSPFEDFVGKSTKGLKVAFIPDAAYGELGATWLEEEIEYQRSKLGFDLTLFELSRHDRSSIKQLFNFDAIFIAGGMVGDLHNIMERSGFSDILSNLLDDGITYIGSSASSMIMSDSLDSAVWYIGEEEPNAAKIRGFGLIDFQIYPHYEKKIRSKILEKIDLALEYWLMGDGSALAINDESIQIFGDKVEIIKPSK